MDNKSFKSFFITQIKKQAFNPYLPSYQYIPDGEPYVFGERVYVYGSYYKFNGEAYCQNKYVCWSTDVNNSTNWRCEGITCKKTQDHMFGNIENLSSVVPERLLFAPDVQVGVDGRHYL